MTTPIKPCPPDKTGWMWFRTFDSEDGVVNIDVTPKLVDSLPQAIKERMCIEPNTNNSGLSPYYHLNDAAVDIDKELSGRMERVYGTPTGSVVVPNIYYEIKAAYLNLPQDKIERYLNNPLPKMTTEEALGNLNDWITVKTVLAPMTVAYVRAALSDDKNELFRADPTLAGKYYIVHDFGVIARVVAVMDDIEVNMKSQGASEKEVDEFLIKVSNPFGEVKDDTRQKYDEGLRKEDHLWTTLTFAVICPVFAILGGLLIQFIFKNRKGGGDDAGGEGGGGDVPATRPASQRPTRGWTPRTRFRFVRSEYPNPSNYRPFVPPEVEGLKQPLMMELSALVISTLSVLPFTVTAARVAAGVEGIGGAVEVGWKWLVLGAEAGAGVL